MSAAKESRRGEWVQRRVTRTASNSEGDSSWAKGGVAKKATVAFVALRAARMGRPQRRVQSDEAEEEEEEEERRREEEAEADDTFELLPRLPLWLLRCCCDSEEDEPIPLPPSRVLVRGRSSRGAWNVPSRSTNVTRRL